MILNLLIILFTIVCGVFFLKTSGKENVKIKKVYIFIISSILVLQSGLRNVAVGADTYNYYKMFENTAKLNWSNIKELFILHYAIGVGKDPGYVVFEKTLQYISLDYQIYLFFIAIIFFSALGNFILKNSSNLKEIIFAYVLYSTLFFFFFSITGHRQTIATAIALWSFEFIKKKKLIKFVILILIASTIHKSVLVFIPLYFVANWLGSKKIFYLSIILFPVLMILKNHLASIMLKLSDSKAYQQYKDFDNAGTITFTLMILLISSLILWRLKYIIRLSKNNEYIICAFSMAIFFVPLTWVNPNLMRVVQYFSIFMIVLIPLMINSIKFKSNKLSDLAYGLGIIILILLYFKANYNFEYKFFWQEMPLGKHYTEDLYIY